MRLARVVLFWMAFHPTIEVMAFLLHQHYYFKLSSTCNSPFAASHNKGTRLNDGTVIDVEVEEEDALFNKINHYTTIGMPSLDTMDAMKQLLTNQTFCHETLSIDNSEDCYYNLCASQSGAQLWGEVQRSSIFGGFAPHFFGKSRVYVCMLSKEERYFQFEDRTISKVTTDGSVMALMDYKDGRGTELVLQQIKDQKGQLELMQIVARQDGNNNGITLAGLGCTDTKKNESFPSFHFDCPNFGFLGEKKPPVQCLVQLAAFAREVSVFDSLEAYHDSEEVKELGDEFCASQFFGAVDDDNDELGPTFAVIVGHVVEAELKINEFTGKSFYWVLLQTACDMQIDVVIHPLLPGIQAGEPPKVGGVISGLFWMSGFVMLDEDTSDDTSSS